jgi:hypothetical protein
MSWSSWVNSQAFQGQHSTERGSIPLSQALPKCLWWKCPLLLWCKAPNPSLSFLFPLMGSQHPPDVIFIPMKVQTNHLPMCTGPNGTCPSGMVLYIKSYALYGLINHRDHSNFNHISSSILLNMCIKSLIHQSASQRRYTSL